MSKRDRLPLTAFKIERGGRVEQLRTGLTMGYVAMVSNGWKNDQCSTVFDMQQDAAKSLMRIVARIEI